MSVISRKGIMRWQARYLSVYVLFTVVLFKK